MTLGLHVNVDKETFGQRQNEIRQQFKKTYDSVIDYLIKKRIPQNYQILTLSVQSFLYFSFFFWSQVP